MLQKTQRLTASARVRAMQDFDIAVIIVSYRTAGLTVEALRSLESQRSDVGLHIRVIVVDNASGDLAEIEEAVRLHDWSSWVTLIEAPSNGGFAFGNNLGIGCAYAIDRPDYIYLLNPDAQARPGAVAALARFLESHPTVGIAGSSFENSDGSDWPIAFRFPSIWSELCQGLQLGVVTRLLRRFDVPMRMSKVEQQVDWICGASMMIRPPVLDVIGGLDEGYFLYFEETDFCYRARRAGFSTWYVPASRVMHMMGQSTNVTDLSKGPNRLPAYWFESRRRFFAVTFGLRYAMLIDVIALLAHPLGLLKRLATGRKGEITPHFIRDLARHSILWPRNRSMAPLRSGIAAAGQGAEQVQSSPSNRRIV